MADLLVSLRDVVAIVANGELRTTRLFVGTIEEDNDRAPLIVAFKTKRVFMLESKGAIKVTDGAKMPVRIEVSTTNISGMVALPPETEK